MIAWKRSSEQSYLRRTSFLTSERRTIGTREHMNYQREREVIHRCNTILRFNKLLKNKKKRRKRSVEKSQKRVNPMENLNARSVTWL